MNKQFLPIIALVGFLSSPLLAVKIQPERCVKHDEETVVIKDGAPIDFTDNQLTHIQSTILSGIISARPPQSHISVPVERNTLELLARTIGDSTNFDTEGAAHVIRTTTTNQLFALSRALYILDSNNQELRSIINNHFLAIKKVQDLGINLAAVYTNSPSRLPDITSQQAIDRAVRRLYTILKLETDTRPI